MSKFFFNKKKNIILSLILFAFMFFYCIITIIFFREQQFFIGSVLIVFLFIYIFIIIIYLQYLTNRYMAYLNHRLKNRRKSLFNIIRYEIRQMDDFSKFFFDMDKNQLQNITLDWYYSCNRKIKEEYKSLLEEGDGISYHECTKEAEEYLLNKIREHLMNTLFKLTENFNQKRKSDMEERIKWLGKLAGKEAYDFHIKRLEDLTNLCKNKNYMSSQ